MCFQFKILVSLGMCIKFFEVFCIKFLLFCHYGRQNEFQKVFVFIFKIFVILEAKKIIQSSFSSIKFQLKRSNITSFQNTKKVLKQQFLINKMFVSFLLFKVLFKLYLTFKQLLLNFKVTYFVCNEIPSYTKKLHLH